MKRLLLLLCLSGFFGILPLDVSRAEFEIWHSPLDLVSSDPVLTLMPNGAQMQYMQVTRTLIVENSLVALGLKLPSDVVIEGITICYAIDSPQCYISGIYLSSQNEPPSLTLLHYDPIHLTTVGSHCYRTDIGSAPVGGTITLTIELDYWDTAYAIRIGAIAVHVSRPVSDAEEFGAGYTEPTSELAMHHPDPFEDRTEITFNLAQNSPLDLSICDVNGRIVRTLMRGPAEAGEHRIIWDGRGEAGARLPAGKYFYRIQNEQQVFSRGIVMLH